MGTTHVSASKVSSPQQGMPVPAEPRGELAARHLAMPAHTNPAGDIFGGWIMASMDEAAAMAVARLVEGRSVTVAVSSMVFIQPVKVGDSVCFYADVKRIGRTSMTLDVEVWVLRRGCGDRVKVTEAEFTFVAVDEDGRPRTITVSQAGSRQAADASGAVTAA